MAPPLADGRVTFDDGTPSTMKQQAKDVTHFLQWAGDPHMVARKETGFGVILFLILLGGIVYLAYRQTWKGHH